ncbi:MAG: hypothetical protein AB8H86_24355 [Polyangiales bacterium]
MTPVIPLNLRKTGALVAVVLWVLGFELLPVAHVSGHHALGAHTHEGGGTTFVAEDTDSFRTSLNSALSNLGDSSAEVFRQRHLAHARAHGAHGHDHDHGDADEDDSNHIERANEPGHGTHSLAHRDLAAAAPPLPPLVPARHEALPLQAQANDLTLALPRVVSALRARGPPAA